MTKINNSKTLFFIVSCLVNCLDKKKLTGHLKKSNILVYGDPKIEVKGLTDKSKIIKK
ncbi:hypothetical protein GCM10022396_13620 [Flavivirga amylovorans]